MKLETNQSGSQTKEKSAKSLRNLVKDDNSNSPKSFEEAMDKVWNPDIDK